MNTIQEIADVLKRLKSAVIFTHTRPDGDTIGSGVALSRALFLLNIKNQVVNDGDVPEKFAFLQGVKDVRRFPDFDAEGYICVDSSDENRLGELSRAFLKGAAKGKVTVNIDHHISNTRYAQYNYVVARASNCQNISDLIVALGVPFDEVISNALMAGIVTDSGMFSHLDVNGDTFRAAARAADGGANVNQITYELFRKQSKARADLYLSVLSEMRFLLQNRLAVVCVTQDALASRGLKTDATEGIVDFGLTIDCVEVSVCLMEMKSGQYKVSLRSKTADVNAIAATFGGGGHVLASGCMLFGEYEEVVDRLRYAVSCHLEDV